MRRHCRRRCESWLPREKPTWRLPSSWPWCVGGSGVGDSEAMCSCLARRLAKRPPCGSLPTSSAPAPLQLVSRRFPAGSTHITAFVSSSGAAAGLAAQHPAAAEALRQRVADAGLSLDVAVLCSREELGAGAVGALEALTSCRRDDGGEEADSAAAPCRAASSRLLWLTPIETAEEMWLQLEPALEQLEAGSSGRRGASSPPAVRRDGSSSPSALPRHISRAPRQFDPLRHPRTSLLASRSGVQQPALCRGESLSRLGHLSSDGMARPWLPTYSSLSQQAAAGARAGAVAAVASTAGRWRPTALGLCLLSSPPTHACCCNLQLHTAPTRPCVLQTCATWRCSRCRGGARGSRWRLAACCPRLRSAAAALAAAAATLQRPRTFCSSWRRSACWMSSPPPAATAQPPAPSRSRRRRRHHPQLARGCGSSLMARAACCACCRAPRSRTCSSWCGLRSAPATAPARSSSPRSTCLAMQTAAAAAVAGAPPTSATCLQRPRRHRRHVGPSSVRAASCGRRPQNSIGNCC